MIVLEHSVQFLPITFLVINPIETSPPDVCFVPVVVKETMYGCVIASTVNTGCR